MVRGFLQGFERGIYNNKSLTLPSLCMDDWSFKVFVKAYNKFISGSYMGILVMTPELMEVQYLIDRQCSTGLLFFELTQWCYISNCTQNSLQINFLDNIFVVTKMLNDVAAEIAKGKSINFLDLTDCFATYENLGSDLGNSGRLILGFNP
jgi:hypothetical protein